MDVLLSTVAAIYPDVDKVRMWNYGDSISWLVYNCHIGIGALGGIIGELLNILSLTLGIYKNKNRKSETGTFQF